MNINISVITIGISSIALAVSLVTAWLTLFRRGELRMTRPALLFFGPDGGNGGPKVYLRTLLYSTSKRGQIVEDMFVRLRRGETSQNFNVWVYGDSPSGLVRGSGLKVGEDGVASNHHFLLPSDGSRFDFLAGDHAVDVYSSLVNRPPKLLRTIQVNVTPDEARQLTGPGAGIYFDWGPDALRYIAHIDSRQVKEVDTELYRRLFAGAAAGNPIAAERDQAGTEPPDGPALSK
jgi:hypothetical protein